MNAALAPALAPLAARVRQRWRLDGAQHGVRFGLAVAALLAFSGRLVGFPDWPMAAALVGVAVFAGRLALALLTLPDAWRVARAADQLGLEERVTSALYAGRTDNPAAALLTADAIEALATLPPARYPVFPEPHRWRGALLGGALLLAAVAAPLPEVGIGGRRSTEEAVIATSRRSVEAVRVNLTAAPTPVPLAQASDSALRALEEELAQAQTAAEAAQAIERTQADLAGLAKPEDYAQGRTAATLAATWQGQPELAAVSRALAAGHPAEILAAVQSLAAEAKSLDAGQRQQLQLALQQGANVAREVPDLSAALRQAASEVGRGGDGSDQGSGALSALASPFAESAGRAAGVQSVQEAIAGLGQARAGLGANTGASGAAGAMANGPPTGSAAGAAGSGNASGAGAGDAGSGDQAGAGSGAGGTSGSGLAGSGGSGAGNAGAGSGTGAGAGGAGAGAGGGPGRGSPDGSAAGSTLGGGNQAPGNPGTVNYDPIYAPSRLGGAGGSRVEIPNNAAGASGDTVDLPNGPLATGAVHPYDQVYGQYAAEARESLARQPLPSGLQSLVQRYFSAIEPEK